MCAPPIISILLIDSHFRNNSISVILNREKWFKKATLSIVVIVTGRGTVQYSRDQERSRIGVRNQSFKQINLVTDITCFWVELCCTVLCCVNCICQHSYDNYSSDRRQSRGDIHSIHTHSLSLSLSLTPSHSHFHSIYHSHSPLSISWSSISLHSRIITRFVNPNIRNPLRVDSHGTAVYGPIVLWTVSIAGEEQKRFTNLRLYLKIQILKSCRTSWFYRNIVEINY